MIWLVTVWMAPPLLSWFELVVVTKSPSRLRSNSTESCRPSSTPNSSVLLRVTSAMSTWMITIGGRWSSFWTTSRIS